MIILGVIQLSPVVGTMDRCPIRITCLQQSLISFLYRGICVLCKILSPIIMLLYTMHDKYKTPEITVAGQISLNNKRKQCILFL